MHVLVSFKKILKTIFENLYETHNFHVISVKLNYWISCFDKKKVFQECDKGRNISFDVENLQQIVWRNFCL
jgi:hypothetical protein